MLTLSDARFILDAAMAADRSTPPRPIAVAIVDQGGHPLGLLREEGAPPLLAHIAQAKAFSCIAYGKPTRQVKEWAEATPLWFDGIARVALEKMGAPMIASHGGVIIRDATGAALGAVGVAGEAGPVDEAIAVTAIGARGFVADPG